MAKVSPSADSYDICHKRLASLVKDGLFCYSLLPTDVENSSETCVFESKYSSLLFLVQVPGFGCLKQHWHNIAIEVS